MLNYMLTDIHPKLPMRDKNIMREFYSSQLGFKELDPKENYGQVYIRTDNIDGLYTALLKKNTPIHPNGKLEIKPWGQMEFSVLDPDNNLLIFGQSM